jgi:hypothetical protein
MSVMTQPRKKRTPDAEGAKKKYPSRENVKYVGIPAKLHVLLAQFAADHSSEFDEKSINWAGTQAVLHFLTEKGYYPPK